MDYRNVKTLKRDGLWLIVVIYAIDKKLIRKLSFENMQKIKVLTQKMINFKPFLRHTGRHFGL